jgi:membrane-associated protease RseP (regulator of RpoE activity)
MSDPPYGLRGFECEFPATSRHEVAVSVARRKRLWLHVLLFALTIVTTLAVGAQLELNYARGRPAFDLERSFNPFSAVWGHPERLLAGIPFSLTLLAILMAHEMGHYLTCRYYGIAASYPYFIPAPTIIGTMGAFIRIREPIVSRKALFDIGISGPLAGFMVAMPVLIAGIAVSRVVPAMHYSGTLTFGNPPLVRLLERLLHPGITEYNLYLHPIARAAWVGLFATALNLLPIGQLDGGHILYAMVGERHRLLSRLFVLALLPLGYLFWYGWLVWATLLFFLGMRHPVIFDPLALDRRRRWLGALALLIFLLCFTPAPFTTH